MRKSPSTPDQSTRSTGISNPRDDSATESLPDEAPTDVLETFGDETTRQILQALSETGRTGRELSERVDVSRATVYRRVNELSDFGLVETDMQLDPDGHHRKRFRATVSRVEFDLYGNEVVSPAGASRNE